MHLVCQLRPHARVGSPRHEPQRRVTVPVHRCAKVAATALATSAASAASASLAATAAAASAARLLQPLLLLLLCGAAEENVEDEGVARGVCHLPQSPQTDTTGGTAGEAPTERRGRGLS